VHKIVILLMVLLSGCVTSRVKDTDESWDISYQTFNYEIPEAMSQQIKDVLERNKGNVLSLDNTTTISLEDITEGTVYEYLSTQVDKSLFKYTKYQSGYAYFDLSTHLDGESYPGIFRANGYISEVAKLDKPNKFSEYMIGENSCKYVIGECEYKAGSKLKKINTSFQSGVWTSSRPMGRFGIGYLVIKKIYDQNGIMLYRGSFSNQWADGKHSFTVRSN
jgi:hypothetical protein